MFKQPSFDLEQYMIPMKGGKKYLPVAPRIAWLREVYPDAQVDIELVFHDPDAKLAVARARVVIPSTDASASDYGSETAKDFNDYLEKSCTKALGRAVASLGFGTLMAQELDEGQRIADTPQGTPKRNDQQGLKVVADASAFGPAQLKSEVTGLLAKDTDGAALLKKTADEMSPEELDKALTWLRHRAKR